MKFEIKNRWTDATQFVAEIEADNITGYSWKLRLAIDLAIKNDVNLCDANLRYANLRGADLGGADLRNSDLGCANLIGANLRGADLGGADLCGANLRGADLSDADLSGANLRGADLSGADLSGAYLRGADLSGADLSGAYLSGANLRGADLSGADLSGAYLSGADLRGADLSGADLSGANLRGADLSDADLSGANLTPIRDDFWAVLSAAPAEVFGLRDAIVNGKIDGSTYEGECACLVGTIANVRHVAHNELGNIKPNYSRPIERFFINIKAGQTPKNNQFSKIVLEWLDEWVSNVSSAFGSKTLGEE